jgi:hypothetical protein
LNGKPEEKKPLEKHKYRWQDNIKKDIREIVFSGVDWIHLSGSGPD